MGGSPRVAREVDEVKGEVEGSGYTLPQAATKFALAHPTTSLAIPCIRNVGQANENVAATEMPDTPRLRLQNWRGAFRYDGRWVRKTTSRPSSTAFERDCWVKEAIP